MTFDDLDADFRDQLKFAGHTKSQQIILMRGIIINLEDAVMELRNEVKMLKLRLAN